MISKGLIYTCGALALALLGTAAYAWFSIGARDALQIQFDALTRERNAINDDARACKAANTGWQNTLDTAQGALKVCVGQRDDAADAGRAAVSAARDAQTRLQTERARWQRRIDAAYADPDCAKTLEAKLCPSVMGY